MRLQEGIDLYTQSLTSMGYAVSTVRAARGGLDLLITETGNIQIRNLNTMHGELFVSAMVAKNYRPGTINLHRGAVVRFCKWAQQRRLLPGNANPLATTRNVPDPKPPRRRVPAKDFARLLDSTDHPQDRVIVALGLYLFLRASEISHLDIGHVDLDQGSVKVYQPKTSRWDEMPICAELDTELRRWLTWYAEDQIKAERGPLLAEWPLVPSRRVSNVSGPWDPARPDNPWQMNPASRSKQIHTKVQHALRSFGWEVTTDDREGVHTLRRSGARALFDDLVETGRVRDGALRLVQAMLHHKGVQITEHYLGLEADVEKRNDMFKGRAMFAKPDTSNVVPIVATM